LAKNIHTCSTKVKLALMKIIFYLIIWIDHWLRYSSNHATSYWFKKKCWYILYSKSSTCSCFVQHYYL